MQMIYTLNVGGPFVFVSKEESRYYSKRSEPCVALILRLQTSVGCSLVRDFDV